MDILEGDSYFLFIILQDTLSFLTKYKTSCVKSFYDEQNEENVFIFSLFCCSVAAIQYRMPI